MEKKFKETNISEDVSRQLSNQQFLLGAPHVYKVATTLFQGVSQLLGQVKTVTVPKAVVFKNMDNSFLAGAKVEYCPNEDDPKNPASGRWDYTWSFYEEDFKGCDTIDGVNNQLVAGCFLGAGRDLYNMRFESATTCIVLMVTILEVIKTWLKENAKESEDANLVLDGVFKASSRVVNGKIEIGIVPSGEMKVLIKNDDMIQEN